MGVESDGTPFISAEQSGGQIEVQLSGNNEFQFLNGGRFRVTRTGVPRHISRGPVTGVTVDHGSTTSVASNSGVLFNMVMVSTGGGFGAVYSMAYNSTVNLIHGTEILVLVLELAQAQMFINLVAVMLLLCRTILVQQ